MSLFLASTLCSLKCRVQFTSLALHKLEGMDDLIGMFFGLIDGFKRKRHDLLDFQRNDFDRDYVEFNAKISELEGVLACPCPARCW